MKVFGTCFFSCCEPISDDEGATAGKRPKRRFVKNPLLADVCGSFEKNFQEKVKVAAGCMQGTAEDSLWQVVHSVGDWPDAPAVISNAIWKPGQGSTLVDNVGWAVEMNAYLGEAFGAKGVVCTGGPGTALSVRIYNGYDSVGDWQSRTSAVADDAGWQERMAAVTAIADGSTLDTSLIRRLV